MSGPLFPGPLEIERLTVGPESVTWRFGSDTRLYLVMLYPLLMQVAHPTVGAGVRDFSDFERRPWNRLFRTLDYVNLLIYGGPEVAAAVGRRLRAIHKGFKGVRADGQPYYALEPEAYAWVHATLLESYVSGHAQFGRPMRRDQIDCFYDEYRGLGRLVGVRDGDLPPDWDSFRRYFAREAQDVLVRTDSVDRVLNSIRYAVPPPVPLPDVLWRGIRLPARQALWIGGVGLLPPVVRERFGLRWSAADQATFRALGRATRSLTPFMPERLRVTGPAQLRWRREAIARGPLGERSSRAATPGRAAA